MSDYQHVLDLLPYKKPFLFVDNILHLDDDGCTGTYLIRKDEYFFEGHFPDQPVVPGVIITEIMAQIGLVCFGIYLNKNQSAVLPVFSHSAIDFMARAQPEDKLIVESKKIYFRFGKLKCKISCRLQDGTEIARGECSGMMVKKSDIG